MDTNQNNERQITPFTFEDKAVRTVMINNEPWFIAKDVCDILGITRVSDALRDFPQNEKGTVSTRTLGGNQEMLTVNEPGLYRIIFKSRKPEAEQFKTWVFMCVLPQIRRTGIYTSEGTVLYELSSTIRSQAAVIESLIREIQTLRHHQTGMFAPLSHDGTHEDERWITTTELSELYGKSRATCLSHARALGWPMRVSRLESGSLTYEFLLAGLPERLQSIWQERQAP